MLRYVIVSIALLLCSLVTAQEEKDSIDIIAKNAKGKEADTGHSFKKAIIYSAVLPGAGQIYNHIAMPKGHKNAYWKVPLIYAGLGATGYFAFQNNQMKNDLRKEYNYRQNSGLIDKFPEYDDQGLLTLYSTYRTRRDLCIVGAMAVYLLNVLDAGVEAHFVNFDVSSDLSLNILPKFDLNSGAGIALTLNFR